MFEFHKNQVNGNPPPSSLPLCWLRAGVGGGGLVVLVVAAGLGVMARKTEFVVATDEVLMQTALEPFM